MFCPHCSNPMTTFAGRIYTFRESFPVIALNRVIICSGCSLVSEVSPNGLLMDLGDVHLSDLEQPYNPALDEPLPVLMVSGATLLRREES